VLCDRVDGRALHIPRVDLSATDVRGFVELTLILLVAIAGKFVGAYVGARLRGVRNRQAGALATLMNTRGLTEIVILTVGLQLGILTDEPFSLMVVMALVTTVMAGVRQQWVGSSRCCSRCRRRGSR
jgi:Kef-type K+ transport system membrane component KefB